MFMEGFNFTSINGVSTSIGYSMTDKEITVKNEEEGSC